VPIRHRSTSDPLQPPSSCRSRSRSPGGDAAGALLSGGLPRDILAVQASRLPPRHGRLPARQPPDAHPVALRLRLRLHLARPGRRGSGPSPRPDGPSEGGIENNVEFIRRRRRRAVMARGPNCGVFRGAGRGGRSRDRRGRGWRRWRIGFGRGLWGDLEHRLIVHGGRHAAYRTGQVPGKAGGSSLALGPSGTAMPNVKGVVGMIRDGCAFSETDVLALLRNGPAEVARCPRTTGGRHGVIDRVPYVGYVGS
ncbi:hypothetical protein F4809DRAFT_664342, partial [Biscogniauxia mediterranea]